MLIRLEVANYKSFRDPQTFSMVASSGTETPGNLIHTPRYDVLKSAAIYGHNAAGKTNLLDVLYAMGSVIIGSARGDIPERVPRMDPFRLDSALRDSPSRFEIELLIGADLYRYRLEATAQNITHEALHHRGAGRHDKWARLLDRSDPAGKESVFVSPRFAPAAAQRDAILTTTVPERSMVGAAAALNVEHARRIFDWFDKQLFFYKLHSDFQRQEQLLDELASRLDEDADFKAAFVPLISDADFGVVDAKVVLPSDKQLALFEKATGALREMVKKIDPDVKFHFEPPLAGGLRLKHRNRTDNVEVELHFSAESSGTRRFMALAYALMRHAENDRPGTIVIDELDSSLSPELVQRFLLLAHSQRYNPSGTQVLFSTHDRFLMDVPDLLRRDQIWVADKREDGSTELYSLADFGSEVKPNVPKSRQFSAGRYGGVAEFGPLLEDVSRDLAPQKLPLFGDR